jgi:hypothetical protein
MNEGFENRGFETLFCKGRKRTGRLELDSTKWYFYSILT